MEWLRRMFGLTDESDTAGEGGDRSDTASRVADGSVIENESATGSESAVENESGVGADESGVEGNRSGRVRATANATSDREPDNTETEAVNGSGGARPRGQPHPPGSVPQGVALFVDGPNVLRDEFDVDLDDVRAAAGDAGPLVATRLYLDEHAPPGLIQAAEARGYRVITTSGDVDVRLAVDVARFAAEGRAATVAVASRDTDFKPAVEAANEYGLATLAIAPGSYGRSDALRNAVDRGITLSEVTTDGE